MKNSFDGRSALLLLIDVIFINLAVLGAVVFRLDWESFSLFWSLRKIVLPMVTLIVLFFFFIFGLYGRVWRYANLGELLVIGKAIIISSVILFGLAGLIEFYLPFYNYLLFILFSFCLISLVRFSSQISGYFTRQPRKGNKRRTLIVGAGGAGALVVRTLLENDSHLTPLAFVDDDPKKQGLKMFGLPVLGGREAIPSLVKQFKLEEAIIALPSADKEEIRKIAGICGEAGVRVKILPSVFKLIDGKLPLTQIRDIQLEDLLRREPTNIDVSSVAGYLKGKIVLVSGGAGSIGSELCRQIASFKPQHLVVVDHNENGLFELSQELLTEFPDVKFSFELADIRDRTKIFSLFFRIKPQVIFHAAAHKHVPLLELCPEEAVKNNVLGTFYLAQAAEAVNSNIFIFISTDKAVEPVNVMGMSKRVGEIIVKEMNRLSTTKFTAVRFGNVLGSRGSVIPLFRKQIDRGGPLTITHPEMSRFFMTIEEAVQLTIQAGALAKGGEIFILNMGEQVKILDLAADLVRLSGLRPGLDIQFKYTGIRPGEKLVEQLWEEDELVTSSQHPKIMMVSKNSYFAPDKLFKSLKGMEKEIGHLDSQKIRCFLSDFILAAEVGKRRGERCEQKNTTG
ncbi:MAG TPA: polysaccharide biosynthesis protein [Clostridia bacterium]|nr:polysaccharide biosynthesis protein [Clostridia bacterium]